LTPATPTEFRNELTACLALTAPVGMSEEARGEWLAVAWQTLKHLPADVLAHGARKARETCDHPAKVVPAIFRETEEWMASRRRMARYDEPRALPPPGDEISEDERAEVATMLGELARNLGATTTSKES
jgi:hypothetical protein